MRGTTGSYQGTEGDMASIFELIIAGDIPADIVYRDEEVVAFRDINRLHLFMS